MVVGMLIRSYQHCAVYATSYYWPPFRELYQHQNRELAKISANVHHWATKFGHGFLDIH